MINTIIFDFGDVFLDLHKERAIENFNRLGLTGPNEELQELNRKFEVGAVTEEQFLEGFLKFMPNASIDEIRDAWNSVIGEIPDHRLEFLQMLCGKYRLFLLTNTDSIHIAHFENTAGYSISRDFYKCFEKVYYSYELGMRKPDPKVFEYLIRKHELSPKRTLFIDDRADNTEAAASLGMNVWTLKPWIEDVVELFDRKIIVQNDRTRYLQDD